MTITEPAARQALESLVQDYYRIPIHERQEITEASVVRQFVDRLLEEVLGWPIKDPQRYKYEVHTSVGRPDITLIPESGGTIFLEAKRFGVIKELAEAHAEAKSALGPTQLVSLTGMATDRTREEQQAINYAFANGGTWAILTNFEKFRLFNARRDWLVFSIERPDGYLSNFDLIWTLAYHNVVKGSLDTLSDLRHRVEVDTIYLQFINEWRERLARDILGRLPENPWVLRPDGSVNLRLLRSVVQRFLDRLVVIRFAEDHLVIKPDTLNKLYELRRDNMYTFTLTQFVLQLFRVFDQNHNSALFALDTTDQASFSDEVLIPLIGKLYDARYRLMPPDIMGNTYEQYLGKTLILRGGQVYTSDNLETRKKQGSYYTPQVIVRYIVDNSLGRYLYGTANGKADGEPLPGETRKTAADIRHLRVLDSACGSGSFLIYAYEVLRDFYEGEIKRLEAAAETRRQELAAQGIVTPADVRIELAPYQHEIGRLADYPRMILEQHLYGVDLDPQAAEIAVVNLMMRAMEGRNREKMLPLILNQNIKVGNSLIGLPPYDPRLLEQHQRLAELRHLRARLIATAGQADHDAVIEALTQLTQTCRTDLNPALAPYFSDLERVRPFHWGIEFPEVFFDENGDPLPNGGFTIIFGNPPWEIIKPDLREFYAQFDPAIESQLTREQAEQRIAELSAEDPSLPEQWDEQQAGISETAAYYRAAPDYTRQGRGDTATHKLFLERTYSLLAEEGRLGVVVPSGIYTDLGTKDLREMLLNEGRIEYLVSITNGVSGGEAYFPDIHRSYKITLLVAQKGVAASDFQAIFRIEPRTTPKPDEFPEFTANPQNYISVTHDSVKRFSPNSLSVMEFQSQRDYEIAEKIYADWHLLGDEVPDTWNVKFTREFDITNDRHLFNTHKRGLPLYEGKMIHQYNAYFAEPQYWLEEEAASERLASKYDVQPHQLDYLKPRMAYRGIAHSTNQRTLITAILPPRVFSEGRGATTIIQKNITITEQVFLVGCLNSLVLDWLLRQKVAANINMFYMYQLPMPRLTAGNPYFDAIVPRAARLTCTRPEFAGLWEEVMGERWDESQGVTDPAERQVLRDEIDAIVAHLYGLSREEFGHILGTFPLVFPADTAGQQKRESLLRVYDAWAGAF